MFVYLGCATGSVPESPLQAIALSYRRMQVDRKKQILLFLQCPKRMPRASPLFKTFLLFNVKYISMMTLILSVRFRFALHKGASIVNRFSRRRWSAKLPVGTRVTYQLLFFLFSFLEFLCLWYSRYSWLCKALRAGCLRGSPRCRAVASASAR